MSHRSHDVIVVGGGISGLIAAHRLVQSGVTSVLVLEAKDRLGGRTYAEEVQARDGPLRVDLGAQWVGTTQHLAIKLLEELGIGMYPQYTRGKSVMQLSDGRVRLYSGIIPTCLNLLQLVSLGRMQAKIDRTVASTNMGDIMATPDARRLDEETFASFLRRSTSNSAVREIMAIMCRAVLGAEPSWISALFLFSIFRSGGTLTHVCESSDGGAQEFKPKGGMYQISRLLAERIGAERIRCSNPVRTIAQGEHGVTVTCRSGEIYRAQYAILAVPPMQAGKIEYDPPLPVERQHYLQRTPVAHMTKVAVTYKDAFWRQRGWSGQAISSHGILCNVVDLTNAEDQPGLVGFVSGDDAVAFSQLGAEERRAKVIASLTSLFGPEAGQPIGYVEKEWCKEEWNGGCPVNLLAPGTLSTYSSTIRKPVGRIHWAGTETATAWIGYVNGAIEAGERVCKEVQQRLLASPGVVTRTGVV